MSKTILRNFAETVSEAPGGRTSRGPKVGVWHREYGPTRPRGLKAAGVVQDFLRVDTAAAERLWAEVENRLPAAVDAARSPQVLDQAVHLDTLRDTIALHFARSLAVTESLSRIWAEESGPTRRRIAGERREVLTSHYRRVRGSQPDDRDLLDLVTELTRDTEDRVLSGSRTRSRVEELFYDVRSLCRRRELEILIVPDETLVIGDCPVVLWRPDADDSALRTRPAWGDAHVIVMPLAPDLAVSVAPNAFHGPIRPQLVAQLNTWQAAAAHEHIFHRPTQDVSFLVGTGR